MADDRYALQLKLIGELQNDWPTEAKLEEERILKLGWAVDGLPYRLATPIVRTMRPGSLRSTELFISIWLGPHTLAFIGALLDSKHACACSGMPMSSPLAVHRVPISVIALTAWHHHSPGDRNSTTMETFSRVFETCGQFSGCRMDWWCWDWNRTRLVSESKVAEADPQCNDRTCTMCRAAKLSITKSLYKCTAEVPQLSFLPRDLIGHVADYLCQPLHLQSLLKNHVADYLCHRGTCKVY